MSFTTDMAGLVADQLARFVTLSPHQLAGQVANLDFWLDQVRHALGGIDGYGVRYTRMDGAQEQYVAAHGTTKSEMGPAGVTERKPPTPRRIPDRELQKARRALVEAVSRFLERCRREDLISESQWSEACKGLGIR